MVTAVDLVRGEECSYTQKEKTFFAGEIALEHVGVVLSLPGFGRQDGNINKQTI